MAQIICQDLVSRSEDPPEGFSCLSARDTEQAEALVTINRFTDLWPQGLALDAVLTLLSTYEFSLAWVFPLCRVKLFKSYHGKPGFALKNPPILVQ